MKALLLCLLLSISSLAQSDSAVVKPPKAFKAITPEDAFKTSVANNSIRLYIIGGIVSAVREREVAFAKKYNIAFHDFGCVVPANLSFYETYNLLVFKHLSDTFGTEWLKEINPNVIGIGKYKEI